MRGTAALLLRHIAVATVLALLATSAHGKVDELDLGAVPTSGPNAVASQQQRDSRIVHAFACDDEETFLARYQSSQATADGWPTGHMMAKAAYASGRYMPAGVVERIPACSTTEDAPDYEAWKSVIAGATFAHFDDSSNTFKGADQWAPVDAATAGAAKVAALVGALNDFYAALFGSACTRVATVDASGAVAIALSPGCLMRQVRVVATDKQLGAWKIVNGQRVPRNPGTSADKLPCVSDWPSKPLSGTEGDWDMGVIEYSRLAHLIYVAKSARPDIVGDDADAALDKLNRWLLTLRGGPARELYDVFWSCGNPANSFGSADDYVNDNDVYNNDTQQTVSGKNEGSESFWEKLWHFLRLLIIIAAAAFVAGLIIGALAGVGGAAAIAAEAAAIGGLLLAVGFATVWTGGIEETENHLFMQNSSKYIKNKLMMAELRQGGDHKGFDKVADENEEVRKWLLKRMRRVVKEDFVEYNARPYSRLSHQAILNLLDFACEVSWGWDSAAWPPRGGDRSCDPKDQAIWTAATSVYDLSAAKISLGSNQGRRLIPFRRLVEANMQFHDEPRYFHDMGGNADHLIAALQAWTASTLHGKDHKASASSIEEMMWYATSRYVPHEMILDLAVDKSSLIEQAYTHGGYEAYSSGPRWLLTAGGDSTHAAQGLRVNWLPFGVFGADFNIYAFSPSNDKGAGVPTTLMVDGTSDRRDTYTSFLRFEGDIEDWGTDDGKPLKSFSHNRCVSGNFACGLRLEIPDPIKGCLKPAVSNPDAPAGLKFISSADCPEYSRPGGGDDFFVVVYEGACSGCDYANWGFLEVVEAKDYSGSVQLYQDQAIAGNKSNMSDWIKSNGKDTLAYYSVARKRTYKFKPSNEDFDQDCRACGSVVEGDDATFKIKNPRRPGQAIRIDYSDDMNPKRTGEGGLTLASP